MRFDFGKWLWRPVEYVLVSAVKTIFMGAIFIACAALVMRWMGYPVPLGRELQDYFEKLARLSDVLS
ncbi:MAG TPA: hypothetical protein VM864_15070 [Pyrinomonadaceae bacterium]|jgi:hypothetical protein|nr:hypothetical protein [Pyrinomonadaceae bacterium]